MDINFTTMPTASWPVEVHQVMLIPQPFSETAQLLSSTTWLWISCVTIGVLTTAIHLRALAGQWIETMEWLLHGPELLARRYIYQKPFSIKTPYRTYNFVSARHQIEEIARASEHDLSLVQIAEEVFQPKHTMNGIELNRLGMQRRILRNLSLRLDNYQEHLIGLINSTFRQVLQTSEPSAEGWQSLGIFSMTQKVVATANTYTFYGDHFTHDATFLEAALQYPRDVFMAAEALRCVPTACSDAVSWLVTRGHQASKRMMDRLIPMIEERLALPECSSRAQKDYVQHVIDLYPSDVPQRTRRIVEQTLALWFASVHQPAITLYYALLDLCAHPELQDQLRAEIQDNVELYSRMNIDKMLLLDSFLKESTRLNSSESISVRRKAVRPFTFNDGTQIGVQDWVCVPQRLLMRDPALYAEPDHFNACRFMAHSSTNASEALVKASAFTDVSPDYPIWGLGKQACPGRFYAVFVVKLVLIELVQKYELRMDSIPAKRYVSWRSSLIPRAGLHIQVRPRQ